MERGHFIRRLLLTSFVCIALSPASYSVNPENLSEDQYVQAYFTMYADYLSGTGNVTKEKLSDVVEYYMTTDNVAKNLHETGPSSGEMIGSILADSGVDFDCGTCDASVLNQRCCIYRIGEKPMMYQCVGTEVKGVTEYQWKNIYECVYGCCSNRCCRDTNPTTTTTTKPPATTTTSPTTTTTKTTTTTTKPPATTTTVPSTTSTIPATTSTRQTTTTTTSTTTTSTTSKTTTTTTIPSTGRVCLDCCKVGDTVCKIICRTGVVESIVNIPITKCSYDGFYITILRGSSISLRMSCVNGRCLTSPTTTVSPTSTTTPETTTSTTTTSTTNPTTTTTQPTTTSTVETTTTTGPTTTTGETTTTTGTGTTTTTTGLDNCQSDTDCVKKYGGCYVCPYKGGECSKGSANCEKDEDCSGYGSDWKCVSQCCVPPETTTTTTSSTTTSTASTTTTTTTSSTTTTTTPQTACDEYKSTGKLPSSWDLRNVNGVNYITSIKDQGYSCGSCWAFAAIGTMEGTYNFEQGKSTGIDLSEQDMVSCVSTNWGCSGGYSSNVFEYLKTSTVCDESCFPYAGSDLPCSQRCAWNKNGWKISSAETPNDETAVKARLLCGGPVAVCSPSWMHCITIVAYDDNSDVCKDNYNTPGCWIIKNEWGDFDGVDGYCGVYHKNGYGYIPYSGHKCSDIIGNSEAIWFPQGPKGIIAP